MKGTWSPAPIPGHCVCIDGFWWHEPGCCKDSHASVTCAGDCCTAPTKWRWVQCSDGQYHVFDVDDLSKGLEEQAQSKCNRETICRLIFRSALWTGTARSIEIPWQACSSCRGLVKEDFDIALGTGE